MRTERTYNIDVSGSVYPLIATFRQQSLFRISAKMTKIVDKEKLLVALDKTLLRFPYFKVELRRGFFRYYFAENNRQPVVFVDDGVVLKSIDFEENNYYLFRVTYFNTLLNIDFYHCLTDGIGAVEFFKSLLYYYLAEKGIECENKNVITHITPIAEEETEDAFLKNYSKSDMLKNTATMIGDDAYGADNEQLLKRQGMGIFQLEISSQKVVEIAKQYKTTVAILLGAILVKSLMENRKAERKQNKLPIKLFIPVNLRKYFPTSTIRNFVTSAVCNVPFDSDDSLTRLIEILTRELKSETNTDNLKMKLNFSCLPYKSFLKYCPLFIKEFFTRIGRMLSKSHRQTIILSNIGIINVPKEYCDNVEKIVFTLNCNYRTPRNCAVITLGEKMIINFSRLTFSPLVEKIFAKELANLGITAKVYSNQRELNYEM